MLDDCLQTKNNSFFGVFPVLRPDFNMGLEIMHLLKDLSKFISRETGSVMMEYIVITAVFMLGVGGVVYFKGGVYQSLARSAAGYDPQQYYLE